MTRLLTFLVVFGVGIIQYSALGKKLPMKLRWYKDRDALCNCYDECIHDEFGCSTPYICETGWMGPNCQHLDLVYTSKLYNLSPFLTDHDDASCDSPPVVVRAISDNALYLTYMRVVVKNEVAARTLSGSNLTIDVTLDGKDQGVSNKLSRVGNLSFIIRITEPSVRYTSFTIRGLTNDICTLQISGGAWHGLKRPKQPNSSVKTDGNTSTCEPNDSIYGFGRWPLRLSQSVEINEIAIYFKNVKRATCRNTSMDIRLFHKSNALAHTHVNLYNALNLYNLNHNNIKMDQPVNYILIENGAFKFNSCHDARELHLCEVHVLGNVPYDVEGQKDLGCDRCLSNDCGKSLGCFGGCKEGYYGHTCDQSKCDPNCGQCDLSNGRCSYCNPGWILDGERTCVCGNAKVNATCDKSCENCVDYICDNNGCSKGCNAGFQDSEFCETPCTFRKYGLGCAKKCIDCEHCDAITGCRSDLFECPRGFYGENCAEKCNNCSIWKCDPNIGCPLIECPPKRYGEGCAKNCSTHCGGDGRCNPITGACYATCEVGFTNDTCEDECPPLTFGDACEHSCAATCKRLGHCHPYTGHCFDTCDNKQNCDDHVTLKSKAEEKSTALKNIILLGLTYITIKLALALVMERYPTIRREVAEESTVEESYHYIIDLFLFDTRKQLQQISSLNSVRSATNDTDGVKGKDIGLGHQ